MGSTGGFLPSSVAVPAIVVADRDRWPWPPFPSGRRRCAAPRRPRPGTAPPGVEHPCDGRRGAVPGSSRPVGRPWSRGQRWSASSGTGSVVPVSRLLDLRGIRAGSRLIEALPGRVRCEPMAAAPFTPLPDSAEAYRAALPSQFRRNLRKSTGAPRSRGSGSSDDPGPGGPHSPRHPPRAAPGTVGRPLPVPSRLRSLRRGMRRWRRGRRGGRPRTRDRRPGGRHRVGVRGGRSREPVSERPAHRSPLEGRDHRPARRHHRRCL